MLTLAVPHRKNVSLPGGWELHRDLEGEEDVRRVAPRVVRSGEYETAVRRACETMSLAEYTHVLRHAAVLTLFTSILFLRVCVITKFQPFFLPNSSFGWELSFVGVFAAQKATK